MSCRVKEFGGGPNWHDLHVLDLSREQVEAFALAYYEGEPDCATLVQGLIHQLYESQHKRKQKLQGLVAQPFYLVRLIEYYYKFRLLPENPALLLDFSVNAALEREVSEKQTMTQGEAEALKTRLSYLAFNMTDARQVSVADKAKAAAWLFHIRGEQEWGIKEPVEPEASPEEQTQAKELCLLAEGASLLSETGQGVQFYHQLVQEYFCAYYCQKQALTPELLRRTNNYKFNEVWPLWAGLSEQGDQSLLTTLTSWLQSNSFEDVRPKVAHALGEIGDSRAVKPLIVALHDQDNDVRASAAYTLGRIGDIRALPHLERVRLEDKGETDWSSVAESAARAIERIKAKQQSQP